MEDYLLLLAMTDVGKYNIDTNDNPSKVRDNL